MRGPACGRGHGALESREGPGLCPVGVGTVQGGAFGCRHYPGWGLSTSRRQRLATSLCWLQAEALADGTVSGQADLRSEPKESSKLPKKYPLRNCGEPRG